MNIWLILLCPNTLLISSLNALIIQDHIKSCLYEEITCPNEQCNESFLRRNLNSHLLAKCKMRVVSCQHCSEKYIHKDVRVSGVPARVDSVFEIGSPYSLECFYKFF